MTPEAIRYMSIFAIKIQPPSNQHPSTVDKDHTLITALICLYIMKCSQQLRIDYEEGIASFVTRRARNSQLVFANNKRVEERVLGSMGKYVTKYNTTVYAFTLFGSHDHCLLDFKPGTKSQFFRDFGARTAEAIKKHVPLFGEGSVFGRRTAEQAVPQDADGYLESIMYIVLQPVKAGLCKHISDYPGFNCFEYLLSGKPLKVNFLRGSAFNKAKHNNKGKVDVRKFVETYEIHFARIPGYEHLSAKEYRAFLLREYERRRLEIVNEFKRWGYKWPRPETLRKTKCTDFAINPKTTEIGSFYPLVICKCPRRRSEFIEWYLTNLIWYKEASCRYLRGNITAVFPPGCSKPPGPFVFAT